MVCHPWRTRVVSPYLGFGAGFHLAASARDGLVSNFKVKDTSGLALQAGAEVKVARRTSLYLDIKKLFYTARASGDLGTTPLISSAKLDPVIVQTGISLRF